MGGGHENASRTIAYVLPRVNEGTYIYLRAASQDELLQSRELRDGLHPGGGDLAAADIQGGQGPETYQTLDALCRHGIAVR